MPLELNALETRILGCLLEKERLTPENYPLSLHSLTAACNQSSNREPVTGYDERTVELGVNTLREKKLAMVLFGADRGSKNTGTGSRTTMNSTPKRWRS